MCIKGCRGSCGFRILLYRENKHDNGIKGVALNQNSSAYIHATIIIAVCFQFSVNAFGSVRTGNMYLSRITSMLLLPVLLARYQVQANASRTRPNQAISQYPFLWLYRTTRGTKTERKLKHTHKAVRSLGRQALADRACATQFTVPGTTTYSIPGRARPHSCCTYQLCGPTLISNKLSP